MSETAFLIVDGEYSDYRVLGAYTSRYRAKKALPKFEAVRGKYASVRIQTVPLNENPVIHTWYYVAINHEGRVLRSTEAKSLEPEAESSRCSKPHVRPDDYQEVAWGTSPESRKRAAELAREVWNEYREKTEPKWQAEEERIAREAQRLNEHWNEQGILMSQDQIDAVLRRGL